MHPPPTVPNVAGLLRGGAALCLTVCLCLGVLVSGTPRAVAGPDADTYDAGAAERFVTDYVATNDIAGAAYVVVEDGAVVVTGAAGDVTAHTPMAVGSLAKSFTAFAVLQLVDDGTVTLDAPVTDYLPAFSVQGADPSAITVRMLLDHTSGLPNPLIVEPTGTLNGDVSQIARLEARSDPGTEYHYSNLNYRTLARLVEVVSGEPFDAYLDEHIFTPLGMEDTASVLTASDRPGLDAGSVSMYGFAFPLRELRASVGGAGGVISTAEDLGAWLSMQQQGGVAPDGVRLLSADLVEQSHEKQPGAGTYALGWQHTSTADPPRIGHDGALTRYAARQDLVPSSGLATAVLLDTFTTTYSHPFEISTGLVDIGLGRVPEVGLPTSTIIELVLLAVSALVVALGIRGVSRAGAWSRARAGHGWWRRLLRLSPHAVMPACAAFLFIGLTVGPGNPATPLDVFGLWPAALILVAVWALVSLVVLAARLLAFREKGRRRTGIEPANDDGSPFHGFETRGAHQEP